MLVSEIKRSPCSFHDPPSDLENISVPSVKKAQPSLAHRRPGHAVPARTLGRRPRAVPQRGPGAPQPASRSVSGCAGCALRPETPGRHRPCAGPPSRTHCEFMHQFILVRKDHCFGRRNFFFYSCSKTAAVQEIKDLNTMTKLFCS